MVLDRLRALATVGVQPIGHMGLVAHERAGELMLKAVDRLRGVPAEADALRLSATEVDFAESICNPTGDEHPDVRAEVLRRCTALSTAVARIATDKDWLRLSATVPEAESALRAVQQLHRHRPADSTEPISMWTVHLLLKAFDAEPAARSQRFLEVRNALAGGEWAALRAVDQRLSDRVAPDTIAAEIIAGRGDCVVVASSQTARPGQFVSFTAWFRDRRFNDSGVRQEWMCVWMSPMARPARRGSRAGHCGSAFRTDRRQPCR